jgi:outer membrane protein assembly factor BamB
VIVAVQVQSQTLKKSLRKDDTSAIFAQINLKEIRKTQILRRKIAVLIALFLMLTMTVSLVALPSANAHTPPWNIPTYAYIVAAPDIIGVGQPAHIYMWLDCVYGAAGGTFAVVPTNGSTASVALLSNSYRFHNYKLTITDPNGTTTTQTFDIISDSTSNQYTIITPDTPGTYTLRFDFPGQVYGANGNGYENSPIFGDKYLPSNATTTLTVQEAPIPAPITSYPLPAQYWTRPIYSENTDWWAISSNWLGCQGLFGVTGPPVGGWNVVSSGYAGMYHQDAVGPLTSHVMWTRPLQFGGIVGGHQFYDGGSYPGEPYGLQYFEGSSYAPRFYNPIIIQGVLYYTEATSFTGAPIFGGGNGPTYAIDLRTGKELWSNMNIPQLSFGYIQNVYDPDQHGVYPAILVSTSGGASFFGVSPESWQLFDAYSGDDLFNVTNVPSGIAVMGPNGETLRYVLRNAGTSDDPHWYLSEWNSSKLWLYDINPYTGGGSLSPSIINASNGALIQQLPIPITGEMGTLPNGFPAPVPYGSTLIVEADIPRNALTLGQTGQYAQPITTYDWNISLSFANTMPITGGPFGPSPPFTIVAANYGDVLLCRNGSLPTGFATTGTGTQQGPYTFFTVNLNASRPGYKVGDVIWTRTYDPPKGNITLLQEPVDFQTRVFTFSYEETMQWVGYSLDDGSLLWGPTPSQGAWDYYGNPGVSQLPGVIAYGNLYDSSFGGVLYCYDDLTGDLKWTYGNGPPGSDNSTFAGLSVFYGVYPTQIQSISNGVVYTATDEHTVPNPIYKGATYRAINATDGTEIWKLSGYPSEWATAGSAWATADGYLTCMNGYDQQIYCIGRGPSATTVSAPDVAAAFGTPVVIKGSVVDIAAGTKQDQQAADFPNGVPCASDASMMDWMGYVYQQKPCPINFTGVPVTVSVLDSNGNSYTIGTAMTDGSGTFRLTYTPTIAGNFTVYASFDGTNGYWPSSAEDGFTVMQEPTATPAPTPQPASLADIYFLPMSIVILIAIIVVGIAMVLMFRRR